MDCTQVKEYLNAYADGFLSDAENKLVEAHLAACAACKEEADALIQLRGEIRALKLENTDDFVFDIARAKQPAAVPLMRRRWVQSLSAVAACCVLFVGVYAAVQNGYPSPASQESMPKLADMTNVAEPVPDVETPVAPAAQEESAATNAKQNARIIRAPEVATDDAEAVSESEAAYVQTDEAAVARHSSDAEVWQMPKQGGAGANAMSTYCKRIVQLSVSAEAQESFLQVMSGILQEDSFLDVAVISEDDLPKLLAIEGVSLVSESTVETQDSYYSGKVIVNY